MSREWINDQIAAFKATLAEDEAKLARSPGNVFIEAAVINKKEALNDFTKQLKLIEAEEAGELMELRFIGPRADGGSMPLEAFLKIAEPLVKAWKNSAHRLRYGKDPHRPSKEIGEDLNLKLAGLAYGSTRILLTGNGRSDFAGENLLQATLTQTFRLLNADNEVFYDAVDAVGVSAARNFSEAMKEITFAGLTADFIWHSPSGRVVWEGRSPELERVTTLIESVGEPEDYEEDIVGEVAGILDTGRLQIRTPIGKLTIRFPLSRVNQVQNLAIRRGAALRVNTSRYYDSAKKAYVYRRELKEVLDLRDTILALRDQPVEPRDPNPPIYDGSFLDSLIPSGVRLLPGSKPKDDDGTK